MADSDGFSNASAVHDACACNTGVQRCQCMASACTMMTTNVLLCASACVRGGLLQEDEVPEQLLGERIAQGDRVVLLDERQATGVFPPRAVSPSTLFMWVCGRQSVWKK